MERSVPQDLREWLDRVAEAGELAVVEAEVDWDQEMAAITYLWARRPGAPALLFRRVRGYGDRASCLWNLLGSSLRRVAITLGASEDSRPLELVRHARGLFSRKIPPVFVQPHEAPVYEHRKLREAVDVLELPVPKHWPRDGGRYGGTFDVVLTRDPEGGWINVGTYRMMVHDRNHVGLYVSPGKDARLHIERAWARGEPVEVVACWGVPPAWVVVSSQGFPKTESELDYIGGVLGRPLELVQALTTSLPVPARAEVALEGVIRPGATRLEGPFGEFTGYYGRPEDHAFLVEVTGLYHRHRPILTNALMADYPSNEQAMLFAVARSARIWEDLERLGVPGIRGVWAHPAAAGGFGVTVVSLEQRYAGHAPQVLALAAQCPGGAYYTKWIIAVDEDVDPSDTDQVLWALATRCNPAEDIDILRQTWSTWLDPTQNPPEERPYGSKALINACKEHRYLAQFAPRTKLSRKVYERVRSRWAELGLEGPPPTLAVLEEDP